MIALVKIVGNNCTTMLYKHEINLVLITMLIVGQVSSKEEANEITFIAKLVIVGERARYLARQREGHRDE